MARVKTNVYLIAFLVSPFYPTVWDLSSKQGFFIILFHNFSICFYSLKICFKKLVFSDLDIRSCSFLSDFRRKMVVS